MQATATKVSLKSNGSVKINCYLSEKDDEKIRNVNRELAKQLRILAEIARTKNVKGFLFFSSSEIYGTYYEPIKETFPMNPSSPYGASKAAADRLSYSYFNTYGLPIAIIRPFNTYGPRHTYDAPPKFISLALAEKDITIYGDGQQSRDLMYVDDTVDGFLIMGSNEKAIGKSVNFGTGVDTRIIDLAKKIIEISGSSSKITHLPPRLSEVMRLCCDNSKAKDLFGWKPKVSIDEGLRKNIEWAKNAENR